MVRESETTGDGIAQFTRDSLQKSIEIIEANNGEVVGFMGDAIYGILPNGESTIDSCFGIAKDIDRTCEYISSAQENDSEIWSFCEGGPSVKIAIEYGTLDKSSITSNYLGDHPVLIGSAINYAHRISAAGEGNRCLIGPIAAKMAFTEYNLGELSTTHGKSGEPSYDYYQFHMEDTWIEGLIEPGDDTYWG